MTPHWPPLDPICGGLGDIVRPRNFVVFENIPVQTDRPTDRQTDRQTDIAFSKIARIRSRAEAW